MTVHVDMVLTLHSDQVLLTFLLHVTEVADREGEAPPDPRVTRLTAAVT